MISAEEFRKVRLRVLKQMLEAIGYRREKNNVYLRETACRQLHIIQYSAPRWTPQTFMVDVGIHYAGVPPFNQPGCVTEPDGWYPVHCWLSTRLRQPDNNQTYPHGETVEEAADIIRSTTTRALSLVAGEQESWSDGRRLLDVLTPEVMEAICRACRLDYDDIDASMARAEEAWQLSPLHQQFPDWTKNFPGTGVVLGFLAMHQSRPGDARRYAEIVEAYGDEPPRLAFKALCKELTKLGVKKR
jgi:hypothetical protein